uniref:Uncharacterized protein n=1 Tax=Anguilla anguilla TaxID=7936 RepID=A0A0E9WF80_ANGAN
MMLRMEFQLQGSGIGPGGVLLILPSSHPFLASSNGRSYGFPVQQSYPVTCSRVTLLHKITMHRHFFTLPKQDFIKHGRHLWPFSHFLPFHSNDDSFCAIAQIHTGTGSILSRMLLPVRT